MKADLTRDTFDSKNHFRQVLAQQGRVQLDADLNEQSALSARRDETTTADIAGHCGGPADAAAFGMSAIAGQPGDFLLSAGRYYVDGIQCELESPISYREQPDLPGLPVLPAGAHLVYLDVWQRHRTFLDDPRLLETALGGVDTATRVKTIWQVRTLQVSGTPACSSGYEEYVARTHASTIRLQARTEKVAGTDDPCQMAEGSGYKSLENQLYRVEVHSLQTATEQARGVGRAAVWKWSRENASVEVELTKMNGLVLSVGSLGRDEKLGIRKGHFVELTDDAIELSGQHGDLIEVDDVDEGDVTITLKAAPAILTSVNPTLHPRVRRWEGTANIQTNAWLNLEAGIQVKFADVNFARPGDYWQIPARTSAPGAQAGDIEWPQTVPSTPDALLPRGIQHHYCRLGFDTASAGTPVFIDCRCLWPALSGVPRLFYLSGDGQEVMPRAALNKLPQPLVAGLANAHCNASVHTVRFTIAGGNGRVVLAGGAPTATTVDIPVDAAGEARCDFHLDATNYSQQVRAELLDAAGQPVRPAIYYNATLSIASEVAYDPKCEGLSGAHTVQDAITLLAASARVTAVGGDGQDGFSGEILPLPLRVAVMSTCGPVKGASIVFRAREIKDPTKHRQGDFALKPTDPFTPEVTAVTDGDGIAQAFWRLPKPALERTFEAVVEVKDFAGHPPEGPREVSFTANLRSSGDDEDSGAVHIISIRLPGGTEPFLTNNGEVEVATLSKGILVECDGPLHAPSIDDLVFPQEDGLIPNPVCYLAAELPYPFLRSEREDLSVGDSQLPEVLVGYRPLVLRARVKLKEATVIISPSVQALGFLTRYLSKELGRLLIRLTLKGNFIWRETDKKQLATDGPAGWLDGDSWRVTEGQHPNAMQSLIDPKLVSGDRRRGGDFEMWFWLVKDGSKIRRLKRPLFKPSAGSSKKPAAVSKRTSSKRRGKRKNE